MKISTQNIACSQCRMHTCFQYITQLYIMSIQPCEQHLINSYDQVLDKKTKAVSAYFIKNSKGRGGHSHKQSEELGRVLWVYKVSLKWPVIAVIGGGDSSVVRAPDSWLKGRGFESLLERRENFLLQGRLSVLTLISVSVPPPCYHSST